MKIDSQEKMEAWFMWFDEAIQIMKNYKMHGSVAVLEDCRKAKLWVLESWKSLIDCIRREYPNANMWQIELPN